jgi:glycosyltransferase involved in cell wall biosynthesis
MSEPEISLVDDHLHRRATDFDIEAPEQIDLSVVIPLYNEQDNVLPVVEELLHVLDSMPEVAEVILVDDGSRDATVSQCISMCQRDERVQLIELRRNFGQTAAISAGMRHARGGVVALMDGDAQNDPHDLPRLLEKMEEGYDVVSGWRRERKDKLIMRRLPSKAANALISYITHTHLHDYGCTLKVYDAEVVDRLNLYGDLHRFIPALTAISGARVAEISVNHRPRTRGKSKYGISRTFRVLLDLITVKFLLKYFERPMRLFGSLGLASLATGLLAFTVLVAHKIIGHQGIGGRPLLTFAAVATLAGLQLLGMGLLGEFMTRIYYDTGDRTPYAVRSSSSSGARSHSHRQERLIQRQ